MRSSLTNSSVLTARSSNTASITRSASARDCSVGAGGQALQAVRLAGGIDAARLQRAVQQSFDPASAFGGRVLALLDGDDRESRIERAGRDAGPHEPHADHADGLDLARLDVFQAGDFRRRPFGEEDMAQAPPPVPTRAGARKVLRSSARPSANGRSADNRTSRTASPGAIWPRARASALLAAASIASADAGGTAQAPVRRRARSDQRPRFRDRRRAQIAAFDPVQDAELQRLVGVDDAAGRDHLDCGRNAGQARQALRSAGAGYDPELHLGQRERGGRAGDPAMRGQREFQAAAERRAVDRRHHRLRGLLDRREHGGQDRVSRRQVELADVRTADEDIARPGDDDRRDGIRRRAVLHSAASRPPRTSVERALTGGCSISISSTPSHDLRR